MKEAAVLAIDQGTTGTRAILYDCRGRTLAAAYSEFTQHYPKPGWVEHDPEEIWKTTRRVLWQTLREAAGRFRGIAAIGITNQRETTVLWERKTGRPVSRAIVWQDRRTASFCASLKKKRLESLFRSRTGLILDPYFSGTKIHWLLRHMPGLRAKARRGDVLFGTMDSWLLWKLTGGNVHATDFTNASRTLLFNIRTRKWDLRLCDILGVPPRMLPAAMESGTLFGRTRADSGLPAGIPVHAILGDQQAALYGQGCYAPGQVKNTYGTGCFLMMNLGARYARPPFGILTTLACDRKGASVYAFEGAAFIAGALIQWLRDGLKLFKNASETEAMARSVHDSGGITIIPAFAGLGSPYWNPNVRGMISGITRGTTRAHMVRAALEAIAQESADMLDQMGRSRIRSLKVDGGATRNNLLMQLQSDLLRIPVHVSPRAESTAWGAAKLAGVASGFWDSRHDMDASAEGYKTFKPRMNAAHAKVLRLTWKREIARLLYNPDA